jgi:transcriptional regulator with XRE-family HTH domain
VASSHTRTAQADLADFLRRRRDALAPSDVGLPPGLRRRTSGLRREEVAALAGMSTDYYTRLEQARGPRPSVAVLASLARALRLTDDERDHLFFLSGQAPPQRAASVGHVTPGLLYVLDRLVDTPAFVVSDLGDQLVQNPMSVALSGEIATQPGLARNFPWRWFTDPSVRTRYPREDWERHSRTHVADLRATHARRRGDEDIETLVDKLRGASAEFDELWQLHEVAVRRSDAKAMIHPEVGRLDLLCETLLSGLSDQLLVVLHPRPGTDAREKLELLRVIGSQNLTSTR